MKGLKKVCIFLIIGVVTLIVAVLVTGYFEHILSRREWKDKNASVQSLGGLLGPSSLAYLENKNKSQTPETVINEIKGISKTELLIPALKNENSEIRRQAVKRLGEIGDRQAVELLIEALKDKQGDVREKAVEALSKIKSNRTEKLLIDALNDADTWWDIVWILSEINESKAMVLLKEKNVEQKEKIFITHSDARYWSKFMWCGTSALVWANHDHKIGGIEWIDILKRKKLKIEVNKNDELMDVTPDGRGIIYTDSKSYRLAPWLKSPPRLECQEKKWNGYIVDLYYYELSSGKKEKIGIMRVGYSAKISPDGTKIFIGGTVSENINIPESKWEKCYFKEGNWIDGNHLVWFQDSSGVITDEKDFWAVGKEGWLFVEIFGTSGWSKVFETGLGNYDLQSGRDNRIYISGSEKGSTKLSLYECKINEKREIICKKILERKNSIGSYVILSNGDIIFQERRDKWIRCISPGQVKEKWVVKMEGRESEWMRISPDGRWLAFVEYNNKGDDSLFIVKLK